MTRRAVALLVVCLIGGCRRKPRAPAPAQLELHPVSLPGLIISLPAGKQRAELPLFEGGNVHVTSGRVSTDLYWGVRDETMTADDVAASLRATQAMFKVAGEVAMTGEAPAQICSFEGTTRSFTLGPYRGESTDWFIAEEKRWFALVTMSELATAGLHQRVLASAQCTPVTARPPPVYPTFVVPEGFVESPHPGQWALTRRQEVLSFNPGAIQPAPQLGFYQTEAGKTFVREHVVRNFAAAHIVDTQLVTDAEGIERVVMSGDFVWDSQTMALVAMYWHCPTSKHTFIALHMTPPIASAIAGALAIARAGDGGVVTMPKPSQDILMTARCPAAQSAP